MCSCARWEVYGSIKRCLCVSSVEVSVCFRAGSGNAFAKGCFSKFRFNFTITQLTFTVCLKAAFSFTHFNSPSGPLFNFYLSKASNVIWGKNWGNKSYEISNFSVFIFATIKKKTLEKMYAASASDGFPFAEWGEGGFYFPFVRVIMKMGELRTYAQHKIVMEKEGRPPRVDLP